MINRVAELKPSKRSRPKSAAPKNEQSIVLRLEKRLKFSGGFSIREESGNDPWRVQIYATDEKLKKTFELDYDPEAGYVSEDDVINETFRGLLDWANQLEMNYPEERSRFIEIRTQMIAQARQLLGARFSPDSRLRPDAIPETQEEAAAKEAAAIDPLPAHSVYPLANGKLAWSCAGCGQANDIGEKACGKCGVAVILPEKLPEAKKPRKSEPAPAAGESLKEIPLGDIARSALNPRQIFDETKLQELAVSITNHGLLQPIVVFAVPGKVPYQIIAGERRFRASQLAKRKTIIARVMNCTEQEAIELRVIENLKREDLNAIEEAQGFQQMIDKCGYSQRDLAARLGVSQGHIGNRLGLLKLPEVWIQRLVSGEIVPTQAREIAPWADSAAFMKELEEWYSKEDPENRIHDWSSVVKGIPWEISRKLKGSFWDTEARCHVEVCLSKKDLEHPDLDIRELPARHHHGEPERRAFNLDVWNELQAAGLARRTKAASKKLNREEPADEPSSSGRSPEREKELREQQAKAWQKKLYRHKIAWIQRAVIAKLDPTIHFAGKANLLIKLLLHFSTIHERRGRDDEMEDVLKAAGLRGELLTLDSDRVAEQALPIVLRWLADSFEGYQVYVRPEQFEQLAAELEIDFDSEYRVERELLELAPKAKLQAWAKEWGGGCYSEKRSELVEQLAIDVVGKEDAPKELLKVKPISLH